MSKQLTLVCPLPNGVHARPASQIAAFCSQFDATIRWHNQRNGLQSDAKSVLGLISGDILFNDLIHIEVAGKDAEQAASQLKRFLDQVLPGCDTPLVAVPMHRSLPRSLASLSPSPLYGQAAAPGVAMGTLSSFHGQNMPELSALPPARGREQEWAQLDAALGGLSARLQSGHPSHGKDAAQVTRAHLAILQDGDFQQQLSHHVEQGQSAGAAVLLTVEHYRQLLARSGSNYLRERELDIRDVGRQLLTILQLMPQDEVRDFPAGAILWADDLTPSEFLALPQGRIAALLLERGGITSHTVILARSFALPVLTGISRASVEGHEGRCCVVDGNLGALFLGPEAAVKAYYDDEMTLQATFRARQQAAAETAAPSAVNMALAVNIGSAAEAQLGFANGAEGVGLFRTEMLYMDRQNPPDEDEQFAVYAEVTKLADGKPVIIRTFDIGGDKPALCLPMAEENNPFLGFRAIRMYPSQERVFRTQLRAILRASATGPVQVMIPMIATLEEIRWVKRILAEEQTSLGIAQPVPLGIMLEVPSVLFQLDAFCQEVDFFSIGSNDLTQYLFAADRDNRQVTHLYDSLHPAFLRALDQAVQTIHRHGRWVGLCGEFGAAPQALPLLAGLGLDELSMGAPSLVESRSRLRELNPAMCRAVLERALGCDNSQQVRELVQSETMQPARSMLSAECIVLDAGWDSQAAVIKGLIDRLWLDGRCNDRFGMEEDIWLREEAYSTGLGYGCAIPHAKSAHVRHPTLCVARLRRPVDWGAADGEPVDVVLMLAFNANQAGAAHLKFFSRLARQIMHADFRAQLRQQADAGALMAFLQQAVEGLAEVAA